MRRPWIALAGLLAFALYTLITMLIAEQSLMAFGRELISRPDTAQVVIDLYLMAALAGVWMYRDARARGKSLASVLPYLLVTAVFVSIGPLLYIVVNGFREPSGGRDGGLCVVRTGAVLEDAGDLLLPGFLSTQIPCIH